MTKNGKARIAAISMIAMALASPVFGQDLGQSAEPYTGYGMGPGMGPVGALCAKEIETYCVQSPRGAATRNCLEARSQSLSEDCRIAVQSTGADRGPGTGPVVHLCVAEIGKFCAEIEHVRGLVRTCLQKHGSELGETCTTALDSTASGLWR